MIKMFQQTKQYNVKMRLRNDRIVVNRINAPTNWEKELDVRKLKRLYGAEILEVEENMRSKN